MEVLDTSGLPRVLYVTTRHVKHFAEFVIDYGAFSPVWSLHFSQ